MTEETNGKEILTRAETADYFSISLYCLHAWVKKGILKPVKVQGRTYFKKADLLSLIES